MASENKTSEEKVVGASYIINFYKEVSNLTHTYAQYLNLMLEIKNKYPQNKELDVMQELDKNTMYTAIQNLRFYIIRTYIEFTAISSNIKDKPKEKEFTRIKELYHNFKEKFVIQTEEVEEYTILFNSILINTVIKNLLESSQDIINNVYTQ
jgi:hypothetical protein